MSWFMAIFLGFVQGVTEFLPISSSGHLALFQSFGLEDPHDRFLFFDTLLHMGTLVAVCIAFRQDIAEIFHAVLAFFRGRGRVEEARHASPAKARLAFMIVIATLPLVLLFPFRNAVEALGNSILFVGIMLLITGSILYFSDRLVPGKRTESNMTVKNALAVGLLQVIAVLPGISRSGTTITGGLMVGLDRDFAVRFSFLMSIPAIFGANIVMLFTSLSDVDWSYMPRYIVGTIIAGVTGFFAIRLVQIMVKKGSFGKFAYYCWGIGTVAIVTSIVQAIMR